MIILNAIVIYLQVSGHDSTWLYIVDTLCTLIFIAEMVLKIYAWSFSSYWADGWNRMDGILVVLYILQLLGRKTTQKFSNQKIKDHL